MPIKEFWEEEPNLIWTYRKMYMDKIKIEQEQNNYSAWLNGIYVFDAISVALYNAFGRKPTEPAKNYIEKPIDFSKSKEEIEREERLKVEEQIKERNRQIKQMLNNKNK